MNTLTDLDHYRITELERKLDRLYLLSRQFKAKIILKQITANENKLYNLLNPQKGYHLEQTRTP